MTESNLTEFRESVNKLIDQSASNAFAVVEELDKVSLITPAEVATLKNAQSFLMSTYTDVPVFRTYMDKYVGVLTNSRFPTPDAKFWQCKKEAEVQFKELLKAMLRYKALNVDIEEIKYKMKELESKKETAEHPFLVQCDLSRFEIKLAEIKLHIKTVEKEIKYRIVEIGDWNDISSEWEDGMSHSKKIYGQHEVESMMRYLTHEISASADKNDEKSHKILESQLSTLKEFVKKKMDRILAKVDKAK